MAVVELWLWAVVAATGLLIRMSYKAKLSLLSPWASPLSKPLNPQLLSCILYQVAHGVSQMRWTWPVSCTRNREELSHIPSSDFSPNIPARLEYHPEPVCYPGVKCDDLDGTSDIGDGGLVNLMVCVHVKGWCGFWERNRKLFALLLDEHGFESW